MTAHRVLEDLAKAAPWIVEPDPGDAGTFDLRGKSFVHFQLTSGSGAETRTLANPDDDGIFVLFTMETDGGGAITLTVTDGYNTAGSTTIAFNDAGDSAILYGTTVGGNKRWRLISAVGTTAGDFLPLSGGTMDEAADIALGTTTGTKIGTAVAQKLGFWNATPVIQQASGDQADQGVMTTVGANTGTSGAGLSLIGNTASVDQSAALMNDLLALQEDIAALDTVVTAIRTALVNTGIIKGAA